MISQLLTGGLSDRLKTDPPRSSRESLSESEASVLPKEKKELNDGEKREPFIQSESGPWCFLAGPFLCL